MDQYCGSKFWDWNTTWYTDDPDFTPCFEKSVVLGIPCAFLWLSATVDYLCYFSQSPIFPKIPLTKLSFCKSVATIVTILFSIFCGVYDYIQHQEFGQSPPHVFIYSPILKVLTLILAFSLQQLDRMRGIHSSGIQFIFWFLLSISESIHLRSVARYYEKTDLPFVLSAIFCSFVLLILALNCFSDSYANCTSTGQSILRENEDEITHPYPELNATFLSRLTFHWVGGIIRKGYHNPLEFSDLWNLRFYDTSNYLCSMFLKNSPCKKPSVTLEDENNCIAEDGFLKNSKNPGVFATIIWPMLKTFGKDNMIILLFALCSDVSNILMTQVLSLIIHFITNSSSENAWKGYFFAGVMFLTALSQMLLTHHLLYRLWLFLYRMRSAMNSAIYRKSLLISNLTRAGTSVGSIVNIMSVDSDKLLKFASWMDVLITGPIAICLILYFLYGQLGVAAFTGLIILALLIPVNMVATRKMQTLQSNQMKKKDERVKKMFEILSGIKIVKLYAWEPTFLNQVGKVRDKELSLLRNRAFINAANEFSWNLAPVLVTLTSFATYLLMDENNTLDAQKAFVSLALFNILNKPLTDIASCINIGVDAYVSVKRISDFMNSSEKSLNSVVHSPVAAKENESAIKIENANFSWDRENWTLKNINISVKKGSLVAIVGPVGCGKSSILEALLGELQKTSGSVFVRGSLAYVPQQPWIQNATVEKNITFGLPFVANKYKKVIDNCALAPDLEILPGKDQTEIGEKGINLSGGQKARVALARAAYLNADVYLLDDPLSAVDSHVGKHIFENVIGPEGMLRGKTRILVTHGISYLPKVDQIIVLANGRITECGIYTELLERQGAFSEFLTHYMGNNDNSEENVNVDIDTDSVNSYVSRKSIQSEKAIVVPNIGTKLIEEERPETGNVKLNVIKNYLRSLGWKTTSLIILAYTINQGFAVGSNVWLSYYAQHGKSKANTTLTGDNFLNANVFLSVYGCLGLFQCIFIFLAVCCVYLGTLKASKTLHNNMLLRILRAPMSFFDTTPLGRIVNRFGSDVQGLDQEMPYELAYCLLFFFRILSVFLVVGFSFPIFCVVIVIIVPIYIVIQRYFVVASRQLFRLNSVARSPIYSHFGETLSGITTIRAFNAQERFIEECERRLDVFQSTMIPLTVTRRWLSVRLQAISSFIVFCSALLSVIYRNTMSPSVAGLSISYAMQVSVSFLYVVIHSTFAETQIVSAERVMEYTEVEQEDEWNRDEEEINIKRGDNWPEEGRIVFKNYQTRYRQGMDLVLKNISCNIEPGEKIGIVGRTGAGKSSVTLGLFRIIESQGGSISIDGIDISTLGLHDIRGRLTIIPQDPVIFSGTIRFNLDPFSMYEDEALWKALEHAHLMRFVKEQAAGLEYIVSEDGGNLSVGQRQLICLARAILRKSKILVLDEATAAVDLETDDLIQNTIREEFKDCTVLTVAHRLNTILDSDRVLVLEDGEIKEFDTPQLLLANEKSKFYEMAKNAGLV